MADRRPAVSAPVGVTTHPDWDDGVLEALYEAAFSQPGAEIIGVLVGLRSQTAAPPRIAAMIPASTARYPQRAALDHAAWAYIHSTMARYYVGLDTVGWWVSRPGPDTQLNEVELAAAGDLFARPGQVGFVFDSRHRSAALYGWYDGRYRRIHEGPIPRGLTLARPTGSPWPLALTAVGLGLAIGLIGWLTTGQPGLMLATIASYEPSTLTH